MTDLLTAQDWLDPDFEPLASRLEATNPGIAILGMRRICVPCPSFRLTVETRDERRLGLVEEFVLKCLLHSEELRTTDAIARLLGLAPLFVERAASVLSAAGAAMRADIGRIEPTETSRDVLKSRELPAAVEAHELIAMWNPVERKLRRAPGTASPDVPGGAILRLETAEDAPFWDMAQVRPLLDAVHRLERRSFTIVSAVPQPDLWQVLTLALYRDFVEHATLYTAYRDKAPSSKFTETLMATEAAGAWNRTQIFPGCDEPFDESVHPRALAFAETVLREQRRTVEPSTMPSSVSVIPPRRIRESFVEITGAASDRLLIMSPWINDWATDGDVRSAFEARAAAGCLTVIGYGYESEGREAEVPEEIERFLTTLRTKEKAPAVALVRVGDHHEKYVGVDGTQALAGSYNFLSNAGKAKLELCLYLTDLDAIGDIEAEATARVLNAARTSTQRLTVLAAFGSPDELLSELERDLSGRNMLQGLMLCLNRHKRNPEGGWKDAALRILPWARVDFDRSLRPFIDKTLQDWREFDPKYAGQFTLEEPILDIPRSKEP